MRAKVGDVIVITDAVKTGLSEEDNFKKATVKQVGDAEVWFMATDIAPEWYASSRFFAKHDCYVLEAVYNSPLYKALL